MQASGSQRGQVLVKAGVVVLMAEKRPAQRAEESTAPMGQEAQASMASS